MYRENFEHVFEIPTADNKLIHGVLYQSQKQLDEITVFIHGLLGSCKEYLHLTTCRALVKLGFTCFGFDFYADKIKARRFSEALISVNVADARTVIHFLLAKGFKKINLIGHSLGCPIAIATCESFTREASSPIVKMLFYDPTSTPSERVNVWETKDNSKGISYIDWRSATLLNSEWIEDAKNFPNTYELITKCEVPIKIIGAENGGCLEFCKRYLKANPSNCVYLEIPGASHSFSEEGLIDIIIRETCTWLSC
jgi:alpha/beta superfamily hydrolase